MGWAEFGFHLIDSTLKEAKRIMLKKTDRMLSKKIIKKDARNRKKNISKREG